MDEVFYHSLESVPLKDIVREEYRNYQIYTLMDRAIPYLQDGLKPVQRRILFTLWRNQSKGLMKVSSATGLVLTLHPHGPQSVEAAIVNMAQDYAFSNNYPLIDKKGYFGERMETSPAASRYIECKLGKVAEILLFDDMNQVDMTPNYDEKVMEPLGLWPKLPIMLLNGSEGIGTGFSSVIPSFHHSDVAKSLIQYLQTGKPKKLKPWFRHYGEKVEIVDGGKIITRTKLEEKNGKIFITELPKGYDSVKTYRYLSKYIEKDQLKDFIDSTVENDILIELVFKRGKQPTLEEAEKIFNGTASISPNYTLISDEGVVVLDKPEEIITHFAEQRKVVVRKRYELLAEDAQKRLDQNNEIIRFIKQKHYAQAEKKANRKAFVDYLVQKKFHYADYLADMAIYRMTKEEVTKRQLLIKEDTAKLKEYKKIAKSPALVQKKLIEELEGVDKDLTDLMAKRDKARLALSKAKKKRSKRPRQNQ